MKLFRQSGASVKNIDLAKDADVQGDVKDQILLKGLFENQFDVFVNATYPSIFQDHVESFMVATTIAADSMMKNKSGSIINFSSIYGIGGCNFGLYIDTNVEPAGWDYNFVKGGIITMSKAMACNYASSNVRINCISPGGIEDKQDDLFKSRYGMLCPMRRMATPEDIAPAVVFLASDEARYITGINLVIDGGWTAW